MSSQVYQCCFCNQKIESTKLDITSFIVISNWDKSREEQQEQQLFCHMECLKSKLGSNTPLYIEDIFD
ncbi:hypothetical protein PPOP_3591 [Paenibacillus popilliae ATCC 14706]|uniref:Uncharacterized protein n=1 Tax=Paenibacillus popilliae ATCC 14706 TaxID=1212764 RepID=M9M8E2_PAEPP|nr:hypothetical protein PPOP_3591 [Paenibacillus popilliae ATCC 14706]